MLARGSQFLPREDQDAATILKNQLESDGCDLHFDAKPISFEQISAGIDGGHPQIRVVIQKDGATTMMIVNAVLFAIGRVPNV